MKKKLLAFLTILMLFGALIPISSVKAVVYKPGDRLSNGFPAPLAFSKHHTISEINPWGDQIHVELEFGMNDKYGVKGYYPTDFLIYSPKNVMEDERFLTEESRDINVFWFLPIQMGFWSDILGEYKSDTGELHHSFDLKLTESLDQREHDVIYYGERFQEIGGTSDSKRTGKIDYSECKQQILSGEVDSVVCEAVTVASEDVRYEAKNMTVEELESSEYAESWNKVKTERKEIQSEKLKGYNEQLEQLRDEVARLKTELAQNMADTKTTEIALESLKNTLEVIEGSEDLMQVVEQLQQEINGIYDQYETEGLRQQLQTILDNQTRLQKELDDSKTLQDDLTKQLEGERENKTALETQITELETKITDLTEELETEKNKTCDCPDKKEEPIIPSCPTIPAGGSGNTSVGGSTSGSEGGSSGKTDDTSSKPAEENRPEDKAEENASGDNNTVLDKNTAEKPEPEKVILGNEAKEKPGSDLQMDKNLTALQTLADAGAIYASQDVQAATEVTYSKEQKQDNTSTEDKNERSENNSETLNEDKMEVEEEVEVPNLGARKEYWLYLLFLILVAIVGSLVYLIRRKLASSGRNQRA